MRFSITKATSGRLVSTTAPYLQGATPSDPRPEGGSFTDAVRRNMALTKLEDMVAWGQKYSVWPFNFGLSCCYVEMATAFTSKFDIARFGITVTAKPGAKVNVKGAYEALNLVPESHLGHAKMKELYFTGTDEGGGAYGKGKISMDDYEGGNDGYVYKVEGKTVKPNGFNVCMLHEIGHAVDDRHKIMAGLMGAKGAGEWQVETRQSVQKALADAAVAKVGNVGDPIKIKIGELVGTALGGTDVAKPEEVTSSQWKIIRKYTTIATSITVGKKPWFTAKPSEVQVDGRVYLQSYDKEWHSYAASEAKACTLRDYQWRSPAEWFADLYGVLWMIKKPAPSAVTSAVAEWFPS